MNADKVKQYVALFGGWLSAVLLFLGSVGLAFDWFTVESIEAFIVLLTASVPFAVLLYSSWKNTYIVTEKAKEQEDELKKKGLK